MEILRTEWGFELASLAFWVSVTGVIPPRLPDVTTLPTPTCLCYYLPERSVQTNYTHSPGILNLVMLRITHIQAVTIHMHTQGRFNNHTARSLHSIMITAASVVGVMNMGNIAPRAGLEPYLQHSRPVC